MCVIVSMNKYIVNAIAISVACVSVLAGFIWLLVFAENKHLEKYRRQVESHCVDVHFKDGNVKTFEKNLYVEIDSTKIFGHGQVFYVIQLSGSRIPYELVEYVEVKESR